MDNDALAIAAAHCDAAALAYEEAMVHVNTAATNLDEVTNRLNLAGVGGDSMTHAQQTKQALEHASVHCAQGKADAEAKAAQLRAMRQG